MFLKIGNTIFRKSAIKEMSFKEFEKTYKPILKGATLKEAFKQLGGKTSNTKSID
jgi:hypothetical protein